MIITLIVSSLLLLLLPPCSLTVWRLLASATSAQAGSGSNRRVLARAEVDSVARAAIVNDASFFIASDRKNGKFSCYFCEWEGATWKTKLTTKFKDFSNLNLIWIEWKKRKLFCENETNFCFVHNNNNLDDFFFIDYLNPEKNWHVQSRGKSISIQKIGKFVLELTLEIKQIRESSWIFWITNNFFPLVLSVTNATPSDVVGRKLALTY